MAGDLSWGDIINAALALYGYKQGQKTPNFYVAPQSPQDAWKTGAGQNLFNYASNYTDQYLRGLGNLNPDWKLNTNLVGNSAFMGGVRVPTFDFSKMPAAPNAAPTPPTPTTTQPGSGAGGGSGGAPGTGGNTGGVTPSEDPNMRLPTMIADQGGNPGSLIGTPSPFDPNMTGRGDNPFAPTDINPNWNKNNPFGSPGNNDNKGDIPTGQSFADLYNQTLGSAQGHSWWQNFTIAHPNWKTDMANTIAAVAAAFGNLPVAIAAKLVGTYLSKPPATGKP